MNLEHKNNGNCFHVALGCDECAELQPKVQGIIMDVTLCDMCHQHDQERGECEECLPCMGCVMEDLLIEVGA